MLTMNTGSAQRVLSGKLPNGEQVSFHMANQSMGLLNALVQGDALYRDNGIRVHIHPILSEYKVTMIWNNGGLYEGVARISKVYKFLREAGIPVNVGWEVFHG